VILARSSRSLLAALALGFFAAACGSDEETPPAPAAAAPSVASKRPEGVEVCYSDLSAAHPATETFWVALSTGNRAARNDAIAALDAAAKEHPAEEQLALLLGLAHLWRLAEPLPAETSDLEVQLESATKSRSELERAYALCPTDHRIPAWLGPVMVRTGRVLGDQSLIDQGLAVLQQGIDNYPEFVLFSKLLVFADEPPGSPDYQHALSAVEDNMAACGDVIHAPSSDPACANGGTAVHNIEGAAVFLGDAFAKGGKKDRARSVYTQAKSGPGYAAWPFKAIIDERLANLDVRIAAYGTADVTDDPSAMWLEPTQCAVCHQSR
jgi:hypothetical protein